ncbi:MAG: TIR domain-containing protein [Timaviella obliquedivisa GSE-PSE-MK23-08B]|jgi:hypothetical protein|nr:TIR domain-containing protein [Timaviella obliquedivisa GSE-PSE-MK23-08B]
MLPSTKDFFISYNQGDRPWAEWLAWTLEEAGYSVIIDAWDFRPGGNFVLEMDKAAKQSHKTIAVLSDHYLQAAYTQSEWTTAFAKDPTGENRSLLTVRVSPCEPGGMLSLITRVDIFGLDEATAQLRVLEALKERAKPKQKPNFPGSDPPVQRVPFPGEQPETQDVDLAVMFREAFPKRIEKWSDRQRDLLQAVRSEVQQRLDDVLNDDVLIPLAMLEQPQQVDRSPLKPRRKLETPDGITDLAAQPMLKVFCQAQRKLLILGDPGAGKTTTLLGLAQELLAGAIATPGTVLPIIFELSAWKDDKQPIRDWLKVQLKEMFNIQPKESEQWLKDKLLLPLLDGLDELGLERQQKCIVAINRLVAQFTYPHLVVCCRGEEYREGGATLGQLAGAVSLEPLGDEQIRRYLLNVGQREFWEALETQPKMGAMLENDEAGKPGILRVPLLLSIAAVAYEGRSFGTKAELLEAYIERRLSWDMRKAEWNLRGAKGKEWAYKALESEPKYAQTQHYLQWLAGKLKKSFQTELLLERIQPEWLDTRNQKLQYRLTSMLIFGITGVPTFMLAITPTAGLLYRLTGGLIAGGLMIGLPFGLINAFSEIETVGVFRTWMSREARREIVRCLKEWLPFGLLLGVLAGQFLSLIIGLSGERTFAHLITLLFVEVFFGLVSGLMIGVSIGLIFGMTVGMKQDLEVRLRPNQGIWNSLQSTLWIILLSYISGVILVSFPVAIADGIGKRKDWHMIAGALLQNLSIILIPQWLAVSIVLGFTLGGVAFIQHFCLRLILTSNQSAPWHYARFLNYCVERRLLQRVGGRYRFLHRELLEHFAERSRK